MQYELAMYNHALSGLGESAAYTLGSASGILNVIDSATASGPAEGIRQRNALGYADIDRFHIIQPGQIVDFKGVPIADQVALLQGAQSSDAFPRGVLTTSRAGDRSAVNKLVNRYKTPYGYSDENYSDYINRLVNLNITSEGVTLSGPGVNTPPVVVTPPTGSPDPDAGSTVWQLLGFPSKDAWRAAGKPQLPATSSGPVAPAPSTPPTVSAWNACGNQNDICSFPGRTALVRYGANGNYATGVFTDSVRCGENNTPGVFGYDPAPGVFKSCAWQPSSSVAPTPTPPAHPPAPPFIPPPAPPVMLAPDPDSDTVWRILGFPNKDAWRAAGKPQLGSGGQPVPGTPSAPIPSVPSVPQIPSPGPTSGPTVVATPTDGSGSTPAAGTTAATSDTLLGFPKQTVMLASAAFLALLLLKK